MFMPVLGFPGVPVSTPGMRQGRGRCLGASVLDPRCPVGSSVMTEMAHVTQGSSQLHVAFRCSKGDWWGTESFLLLG